MEENIKIEEQKKYRRHLYVFLSAFALTLALSWLLPVILSMSERTIERTLLACFAGFLVFFLIWIKKS